MTIANRLKAARTALVLSQTEASNYSGVPVGTLRKYEQGPSLPGAEAIAGFVRLGINANWLLTGEGVMLLADMVKPGALDTARLRLAVETVEEGLNAARTTMEAGKKADLVLAAYDLLEGSGANKAQVLKLIKLAA